MDYQSIHGLGISNFPASSQHRMPTVSAAQALQELKSSPTRCISSGLPLLDLVLQNRHTQNETHEPFKGGVSRGKVTEVYGPPGVGKTALGMQLAANALLAGEDVMWADASHALPAVRFLHILDCLQQQRVSSQPQASSEARSSARLLENFHHFSTPTLAHLLALFARQTPNNPPPTTSLIILDSFSTLVINAFPRNVDSTPQALKNPKAAPKPLNPSARKFPILQHILGNLQKLAATRNIAIVIISQCVTKMRPGSGAVLAPSINITQWEQGLACRVALFRDWGWSDESGNPVDGVRLAQVIKAEGTVLPEGKGRLAGFTIDETGLIPLTLPAFSLYSAPIPPPFNPRQPHLQYQIPISKPQALTQKRKRAPSDLEVPDSEDEDDEDYGWGEEDEEEIPAMPPQWQGSEDILIPDPADREVGKEEECEDESSSEQGEILGVAEIVDSEDELAL